MNTPFPENQEPPGRLPNPFALSSKIGSVAAGSFPGETILTRLEAKIGLERRRIPIVRLSNRYSRQIRNKRYPRQENRQRIAAAP
jgi:hypothetical protein